MTKINSIGQEMFSLMQKLFPICRSITGNGLRQTLNILQEMVPLQITEVPTGTRVFDWVIPDEWNIEDAYVKDDTHKRIIDFQKSNLHIVNYSIPFEGEVTLQELDKHLYSLPDQPHVIPYVTSYYERRWGFCLPHQQRETLRDPIYYVKIDSTLKPGSLTYADFVVPGESEKEILFSTYVCHPSMANNELSGPIVSIFLLRELLLRKKCFYTYRFVFVPETIGSIAYISRNLEHLKKNVVAGYVITCIGDPCSFSYLMSRKENTLTDRVTQHILQHTEKEYKVYNFTERGSDERQYSSPGVDLPIGSLMRSKYGTFKEYHTSADNLAFVTADALEQSLKKYQLCIDVLEANHKYKNMILCEPQLGARGLYPTLGARKLHEDVRLIKNILAYCDGEHDLLWIAEKVKQPIMHLIPLMEVLQNKDLCHRI